MREYIRKSSGVPKVVYLRMKTLIMDYNRLRSMRANLLFGSATPADGMSRIRGNGQLTEDKAIKLAVINREIEAIEQVAMLMRGEYSGKTYEEFDPLKAYQDYNYFNYQHIRTEKSPNGPSTRTWHRYKDVFTLRLAKKLNIF